MAEEGGEVVGYVALGSPTRLESNRHVMDIRGLGVAPERQGRGLGRALIDAAVAEARRRGARKLRLRVLGANSGARACTSRAGSRSRACCARSSCSTGATSTTC